MIGTTLAALASAPIAGPDRLRPYVIPIIGVMLGATITPDILGQLGSWAITLLILPVYLAGAAGGSYFVYRRVGRYDPITAYYASMPGGLNEMLLVGEAMGGDARQIALAHSTRILLVIFVVALAFGFGLGVSTGGGQVWIPFSALSFWDGLVLLGCAILGTPMARALQMPAAPVFGPMILSGVVHATGWITVAPPTLLVVIAQIVIGTVIGARFIGTSWNQLRRDLVLAALTTACMLAIAFLFAEALAVMVGMPLSQAFLALAPGGLTEMSLLALALDQEVAFVSVTHIARITLIIALAPVLFSLLRRFGRR